MSTLAEMNSDHLEGCACNGCAPRGTPWDYHVFDETWEELGCCKHCGRDAGKHLGGNSTVDKPWQKDLTGRCNPYGSRRTIKINYSMACTNSWFEARDVNPS